MRFAFKQQRYIPSDVYLSLVCRDPDQFIISEDKALFHYIDQTVLIEQKASSAPDILVKASTYVLEGGL